MVNKEEVSPVELLHHVASMYSTQEIADEFGIAKSTVLRWLKGEVLPKPYISEHLHSMIASKVTAKSYRINEGDFTFIDLFAGIGGMRKGFEMAGGQCIYTSEWDPYAQRTYAANFPSEECIVGDITKVDVNTIPNHDVLLAGFPCQPFSIAGVSKKNALGRPTGFGDKTQGTLFFDVARIIKAKQPKAFVLENVKNLKSHDSGHTFKIIMETLAQELGYSVDYKIIDGQSWVPQHRERIVIVGFREMNGFTMDQIGIPHKGQKKLGAILHACDGSEPFLPQDGDKYFDFEHNCVNPKYTLTDKLWSYLQSYADKHRSLGNGFGYGLVTEDDIARTLSARYYKDGSEILIYQGKKRNPRRLTPRECARLMGFPDDYIIPVSDTRAYKQFGNSVIVPLFEAVANAIKPYVIRMKEESCIIDTNSCAV